MASRNANRPRRGKAVGAEVHGMDFPPEHIGVWCQVEFEDTKSRVMVFSMLWTFRFIGL